MNLFILICSALFSNIMHNITNYFYVNRQHYSGNDERVELSYPFTTESENEILSRIRKYYYCMAIINYLESSYISEKDKIELIEQFEIGKDKNNIDHLYSGGLMNDWEMDF